MNQVFEISSGVLTFDNVTIDKAANEVRLNGQPNKLEPRAFAVLVFLIENRHRVVKRDELLLAVWGTLHVTENAISQTIMKVRRAIGDDTGEQPRIKTVHRIGYRFVGDVAAVDARTDAQPQDVPLPRKLAGSVRTVALAVLPFDNATEDESLAWIELGLATLVVRSLAKYPSVRVASIEQTLTALATIDSDAPLSQQLLAIDAVLGCANAVAVRVILHATGYQLQWSTFGPAAPSRAGTLEGPILTDLAIALTTELAAIFAPMRDAASAGPFLLGDDFLNTAFSRGMQAVAEQRFAEALKLLQICADVPGHPTEVDLQLLRTMARTAHEHAGATGKALLQRVRDDGDALMEAELLTDLAFYARAHVGLDEARVYADQALKLADTLLDPSLSLRARGVRALIAIAEYEFSYAKANIQRMLTLAQELGDESQLGYAMGLLGQTEALLGNIDVAVACLEKGIESATRFRLVADRARLGLFLIRLHINRGQLGAALREAEATLDAAIRTGSDELTCDTMMFFLRVCSLVGALDKGRDAYARAQSIRRAAKSALSSAKWQLVDARMAFLERDLPRWSALIGEASPELERHPEVWIPRPLLDAITEALYRDDQARVDQLLAQFATATVASPYDGLHQWHFMAQIFTAYQRGAIAHARSLMDELFQVKNAVPIALLTTTLGAWLALDEGDIPAAEELMRLSPAMANEALSGHAVRARLAYLHGDFNLAATIQDHYVRQAGAAAWPYHRDLADFYRRALAAHDGMEFPSLPSILYLI